jgi:hypothetical protein
MTCHFENPLNITDLQIDLHGGYQVNFQIWFSCLYKFIKIQINRTTYPLSLQDLNSKLFRYFIKKLIILSQSIHHVCTRSLNLKFTHVNRFDFKIISMNKHVIECNFMLSN